MGRREELSFHGRGSVEHEPERLVDVAVRLIDHTNDVALLPASEEVSGSASSCTC